MPWWSSSTKGDKSSDKPVEERVHEAIDPTVEKVNATAKSIKEGQSSATGYAVLQVFKQPQTILAAIVLTTFSLGLFRFYRTFLRRIPEAVNIRPSYFQKRSILGKVTSVGDGDNFRIYHTPGGWLAGWGWLPWRRVPTDKKELKNQTIHVRLAGVDAPELAHFGRPSQPYGQEALDWLTSYVQGRRIRAYVHKADQYSRVVATAYVWKGFLRRDIGLQMLRAGMATVYEAKTGAEFGEGLEQKYRNAEWWAKMKRKGMWASSKKEDFESPREYKTRHGSGTPIDEEAAVKKG